MTALIVWAVLDVFRTTVVMGHYEDRITVVTHGEVDVVPAWLAYMLLEELLPRGGLKGMADVGLLGDERCADALTC